MREIPGFGACRHHRQWNSSASLRPGAAVDGRWGMQYSRAMMRIWMVLGLAMALAGCDEKKPATAEAPASGMGQAAASGAAVAPADSAPAVAPSGAAVAPSGAAASGEAAKAGQAGESDEAGDGAARSRVGCDVARQGGRRDAEVQPAAAAESAAQRGPQAVVPSRRGVRRLRARGAGGVADARARRRGAGGAAALAARGGGGRSGAARGGARTGARRGARDRRDAGDDRAAAAGGRSARRRRRQLQRRHRRGRARARGPTCSSAPTRGGAARASPSPCGVTYLAANEPDVVIIVDADCRVEAGAIDALRAAAVERPAQAAYVMRAPDGAPPARRLAELMFLIRNVVRPLGLARLGVPCLLTGAGMAFPWSLVARRGARRRAASSRICSSRSISRPTGRRRASAARRA